MAEKCFFITGATGLLGTEVVAQLLKTTDSLIYVWVRAESDEVACRRLQSLWWEDNVLSAAIGQRVIPVVGDLSSICTLTHVIHCAAD